jgi:tetratricopeptide (TPR) repeat protein
VRRGRVAVAALLLTGCAYYNGLYNANRLARDAVRAERDGRTGEARSLWSQAAVKAESVASRHPGSKYRDDALYLQGRALERVGSCTQALPPLALAADSSPDPALRVDARLLLGDCRLQLREPESTLVALDPILDIGSPAARSAALLLRGRALLLLGRNEAALEELTASGAREGAYAKAIALARLDRLDEAAATLGGVVEGSYLEEQWLRTLDSVGRRRPEVLASVIERLAQHPDVRDGQRARLWLGDGERWLAIGDTAAAEQRFLAVREIAADSSEGRTARAHLAIFAGRRVRDWTAVRSVADSFRVAVQQGGVAARIGGAFSNVFTRARNALEPDGTDLGLFLAAEDVRDSVRNRVLAGSLLEQVIERHPTSVIAPKALLALAAARPAVGDSLVGVLRARYPESPYTLVLAGTGGAAYEALEDSLRRVAADGGRRRGRDETEGPRRRADSARRVRNDP